MLWVKNMTSNMAGNGHINIPF